MSCAVDRRRRAHAARDALREHVPVLSATVIDAATDPAGRWTVEFLTAADAGGVPPAVCRTLAAHDCTLRSVTSQHPYRHAVAVVA